MKSLCRACTTSLKESKTDYSGDITGFEVVRELLSNWVNRALVNSNFQLDVGFFDLRFEVSVFVCNFK